ncbi:MAG: hypothetical protein C0615_11640 [Desulfuromonas sp.]|nr:MAG: hypothetical protein C0615_11640 [Desulfuromonas sp.]
MDKSSLINEITAAFEGVLLDGGIGIYEANVIDDYGSAEEREKAKHEDATAWTTWQEIPDDILSNYYTTFCFVDSKGFKFLIPAYMIYTLKQCQDDASASIDATIYALQPGNYNVEGFAALLTPEQKKTIARFLEYLILEVGDKWIDATAASQSYEGYWNQYG